MITDYDLGWLIGITDGEGCFCITKYKPMYFMPRFSLSNTNFKITDNLCRILDLLDVKYNVSTVTPKSSKHNVQRTIAVHSLPELRKLLDIILPHMACRFDQAWTLNEFVNLRLKKPHFHTPYEDEEQALYVLLRQENQK